MPTKRLCNLSKQTPNREYLKYASNVFRYWFQCEVYRIVCLRLYMKTWNFQLSELRCVYKKGMVLKWRRRCCYSTTIRTQLLLCDSFACVQMFRLVWAARCVLECRTFDWIHWVDKYETRCWHFSRATINTISYTHTQTHPNPNTSASDILFPFCNWPKSCSWM